MTKKYTKKEFIKLLNSFDWQYVYRQNNAEFWEGQMMHKKIQGIIINQPELRHLYTQEYNKRRKD